MKITLIDQHLSLFPFESEELSDFTVITGLNGSGKSQLLELIASKYSNTKINKNSHIRLTLSTFDNTLNVQYEGIIKDKTITVDREMWERSIKLLSEPYINADETTKRLHSFLLKIKLFDKVLNRQIDQILSDDPEYISLMSAFYSNMSNGASYSHSIVYQKAVLEKLYYTNNNLKSFLCANYISNHLRKNVETLTELDFYTTPLDEYWADENTLFQSNIETLFFNYARRRMKNDHLYYRKERYNKENISISDDEFINKYTEPWVLINNILERYNIDFIFKGIDPEDFDENIKVNHFLYKKSTGAPVLFEYLSSGEKVIIGLIMKLFLSDYYEKKLEYPDLILLDEPDAHLHPEMSKLLIDILNDVFVSELGIKVIITTHSPSTVALAPEESIFQLKNGNPTSLEKISKDDALKLLTGFIPTLSIDYKNHRQVFVESSVDVAYYQQLYDIYQQNNQLDYKLYFIANKKGDGNCDLVYSMVESFEKAGNTTCYGIVDWDFNGTKGNSSTNRTFVHGENERYSLENFVLDPIYILALLLENKMHNTELKDMNFSANFHQYAFKDSSQKELQGFVNEFFKLFKDKYRTFNIEDVSNIDYLNGISIQVPKEYLLHQGHSLDAKVKEIFPHLKRKYPNEGDIQNAIYSIIIKNYPLVPMATINVIKKLSTK